MSKQDQKFYTEVVGLRNALIEWMASHNPPPEVIAIAVTSYLCMMTASSAEDDLCTYVNRHAMLHDYLNHYHDFGWDHRHNPLRRFKLPKQPRPKNPYGGRRKPIRHITITSEQPAEQPMFTIRELHGFYIVFKRRRMLAAFKQRQQAIDWLDRLLCP